MNRRKEDGESSSHSSSSGDDDMSGQCFDRRATLTSTKQQQRGGGDASSSKRRRILGRVDPRVHDKTKKERDDDDDDTDSSTSVDSEDSEEVLLRRLMMAQHDHEQGRPAAASGRNHPPAAAPPTKVADTKTKTKGRRRPAATNMATTKSNNNSSRSDSDTEDSFEKLRRRRGGAMPTTTIVAASSTVGSAAARKKRRRTDSNDKVLVDSDVDSDDDENAVELLRTTIRPPLRPTALESAAASAPVLVKGGRQKDGGHGLWNDLQDNNDDDHVAPTSIGGEKRKTGPPWRLQRLGRTNSASSLSSIENSLGTSRQMTNKSKGCVDSEVVVLADDDEDGEGEDRSNTDSEDGSGYGKGRSRTAAGARSSSSPQSDASSVDTAELLLHLQDPVAHPPARSKSVVKKLKQQQQQELEKQQRQQVLELERQQQALRLQEEKDRQHQQDAASQSVPCDDDFRLGDDDDDSSSSSDSSGSNGEDGENAGRTIHPILGPSHFKPLHSSAISRQPSRENMTADHSRCMTEPIAAARSNDPTTPEPAPTIAFLQRPERSTGALGSRININVNTFTPHSAPQTGSVGATRTPGARSNPYHQRRSVQGAAESSSSTTNPTAAKVVPTAPPSTRRKSAPDLQPGSQRQGSSAAAFGNVPGAGPKPPPQEQDVSNDVSLEAAFWHEDKDDEAQGPSPPAEATVIVRQGLRSPPSLKHTPYRPPLRRSPSAAEDIHSFSDDENHSRNDAVAFGFAPSPPHHPHEASREASSSFFGQAAVLQPFVQSESQQRFPSTSRHLPTGFCAQPMPPNPSVDDYKSIVLGRRKRVRDAVASNPLNASGVVLRSSGPAQAGAATSSQRPRQSHPLHGLTSLSSSVLWRTHSTANASTAAVSGTARAAGSAETRGFSRFSLSASAPQRASVGAAAAASHTNDQAWSLALAPGAAVDDSWTQQPWTNARSSAGGGVSSAEQPFDGQVGNSSNNSIYYGEEEDEEDEEEGEENFGNHVTWGAGAGRPRGRGSSSFRGKGRGGVGTKSRSTWRTGGFGRGKSSRGGRRGGGRSTAGRGGGGGTNNNRWGRGGRGGFTSGGGTGTTSRDDPNLRHVGGADMSF